MFGRHPCRLRANHVCPPRNPAFVVHSLGRATGVIPLSVVGDWRWGKTRCFPVPAHPYVPMDYSARTSTLEPMPGGNFSGLGRGPRFVDRRGTVRLELGRWGG